MESISQTTATPHRNSRRPSAVPDNCMPPTLDDVNNLLSNSCPRKTNVSRPRSTRPPRDVTSAVRAKSTQRRRLPEDVEKPLKVARPKSLVRNRPSDNDNHSTMFRNKETNKDVRRHVATDDESQKRSIRPNSARRIRSSQDESSSPLRSMKSSNEQRIRPDHDTAKIRRTRPKSVQRDRLLDDSPTIVGPKRKESLHQGQRPRKEGIVDNSNVTSSPAKTKSRTAGATNDSEDTNSEKQRHRSTIIPKSNGTDRRRRCSTSDVHNDAQPGKQLSNDRRKSELNVARSSELPKVDASNSNASNDLRRRNRTPGRRGDNNDDTAKPRRGDIRKHRSSPDIDLQDTEKNERRNAALSKSKSVRNNSPIKNASEKDEQQRTRRNIVRKPSMQANEKYPLDDIGNSSSHSSTVSTAVFQFDPTQQSGVAVIAQHEVIERQEKIINRTLVRKPSLQIVSDDNNELERSNESEEKPSRRGLVRKPSMINPAKGADEIEDDGSVGSRDSSSASTVIQFDPTQQNGVTHVDPNDLDDCVSIAIFGESTSIVSSEMENSWAAPILAFHDSDGEELDEKPVSRRHNSSTKLLHSLQRRPSCGDSVHTKSSESHTTSSSFGRPQYYAPPLRNPTNPAAALTATFAEFIEKDQSIDDSNTDNVPLKSKTKKKNFKGDLKAEADDEKSLVGQKAKTTRPKLMKEVSNDRKKSSFDDVPVLRQMLNTSNHSTHSLLASDSEDDSFDDDRRMSDVFKPTPLNNIVNNSNVHMTAYESETESDASSSKKGKGSRIGKYFFGGGNNSSSTHSRQMRPKRDVTVEESEASDSEYSCSSVRSNSSRRSGVFGAATRRLMKSSSNRHALLGDGEVENDVVPFSW